MKTASHSISHRKLGTRNLSPFSKVKVSAVFLLTSIAGTSAFAQAGISFSGNLDIGVYQGYDGENHVGSISRSSFTVAGERDLTGGVKGIFKLSTRFDLGSGSSNDPDGSTVKPFWHGEATVGVKSAEYGTLRLGRALDVLGNNTWAYDPWYNFDSIASPAWQLWQWNYVTGLTNSARSTGQPAGEYGRLNNGVFYDSPIMGGFSVALSGSFDKDRLTTGNTPAPIKGSGNLGLALKYNQGPTSLMLASTKNAYSDEDTFVGGSYSFGSLQVMGALDRTVYGATQSSNTAKTMGLAYTSGAYRYTAGYGTIDTANKINMVGLGAQYTINTQANTYLSYGRISQDNSSAKDALGVGINYSF